MGVEDGENEFAYQATVKIGGHIFKGVLYDQGLDSGQVAAAPSSSLGDLQLGGSRGGMPSSSALIDPASLYVSGSALLGGQPLDLTVQTLLYLSSSHFLCVCQKTHFYNNNFWMNDVSGDSQRVGVLCFWVVGMNAALR